jgi:hypothetical protein
MEEMARPNYMYQKLKDIKGVHEVCQGRSRSNFACAPLDGAASSTAGLALSRTSVTYQTQANC